MALITPSPKNQATLDAQLELWHHTFGYIKSMALKSALDLCIADAIHDNGGTATLPQIVTKITLHESKFSCLRRLMRVLTVTGVFSVELPAGSSEQVYGLTSASRLLVTSTNYSPFLSLMVDSFFVSPFFGLGKWFQRELPDPALFKMTHGKNVWDFAGHNKKFAKLCDDGMVADSGFTMDIIVKECGDVFHGISSLNDWVLHDWGDDECVKILRNCRKAIPPRDAGGKVIIFDMVVGSRTSDLKHTETQVFFDLFIMFINGAERDEQEWKKIIFEAGFSDYKIIPLGIRSIIEVYP
ncbi:hypothetical protein EJB05_13010, partial [Eragrostis curvula]